MSSIFCCSSIQPYKSRALTHEPRFRAFMSWAPFPRTSSIGTAPDANSATLAVQVVRQINFGALESKRYFASSHGEEFIEVAEQWLIDANYEKLNTFKNYKCGVHDRFFEVNVYQRDPVNAHHWRANVARPASEIDL